MDIVNWLVGGGFLALLGGGYKAFTVLKDYVNKEVEKERKKCEEEKNELQKSIDRLEKEVFHKKVDIFNSTIHPMWIKKVSGEILDVNPAFLKFIAAKIALTRDAIIGNKMEDLFPFLSITVAPMDFEARKKQTAVHKNGVRIFDDEDIKYTIVKELFLMNNEAVLFGTAITEN